MDIGASAQQEYRAHRARVVINPRVGIGLDPEFFYFAQPTAYAIIVNFLALSMGLTFSFVRSRRTRKAIPFQSCGLLVTIPDRPRAVIVTCSRPGR